MKTLISLALFALTPVFACQVDEALVIGEVTKIEQLEGQHCKVFVDFSYYKEHVFCPLDKSLAESEGIAMAGIDCDPAKNVKFDGVIKDNGEYIYPEAYEDL